MACRDTEIARLGFILSLTHTHSIKQAQLADRDKEVVQLGASLAAANTAEAERATLSEKMACRDTEIARLGYILPLTHTHSVSLFLSCLFHTENARETSAFGQKIACRDTEIARLRCVLLPLSSEPSTLKHEF